MVEEVRFFRAEDGTEFSTREAAEKHERETEPRRLAALIIERGKESMVAVLMDRGADEALADAIERAGTLIAKARRAAGELRWRRAEKSDESEPAQETADEDKRAAA